MNILRDLSIAWSFLHVVVLFVFLYESRYPTRKTVLCTVSAMVPWLILNSSLFVILGPVEMARMIHITATMPALVFFFVMAKHRDGRFFFTFCFAGSVSYGVVALTSIIDYYLFDNRYVFMLVSRLLIFPVLELVAWKYVRTLYHDLQRTVKKGWGAFAVVSALFYVLLALMSAWPVIFYENPGQTPALLLAVALMVMMYLNVFQVLSGQQKIFYAAEEERRLNQQTQLLHNELSAEQEYVFNARRFRHDLHHHNSVVYAYLEEGEVEKAKQYLKAHSEHLDDSGLQNYCENPTVNALLRITARRCAAAGADFRFEGGIPRELAMTEPETGTVFGNLLENACEACEKCTQARLHIKSELRQNILYLEIRNSVSGRVVFDGDYPGSTKPAGGIGIQSVNTVLAQYDGMMTCYQRGNQFVTRVILPL